MPESVLWFVKEYGLDFIFSTGLVFMGWLIGRWRSAGDWRAQRFRDRVHISLTSLKDGQILIRTLAEKPMVELFGNEVAARSVRAATARATQDDPILDLPRDAYWRYLNGLVNELSQLCVRGHIAADLGVSTNHGTYVFCLTCETAPAVRTRKVRVLVVRKDRITDLPDRVPTIARDQDIVRWQTLLALAKQLPRTPWRFGEVDLSV